MSKVIVTGGAGFIGSHLVDRLLKEGHKVVVIDNFSMGRMDNLPESNKDMIIFGGDILDNNIGFLFEDVDVVFHLAALTRPRESFKEIEKTNNVNVNGTLKVLLHSEANKVGKFIFVSSASAYGYQPSYPFLEDKKLNPASPYALTKAVGEQYAEFFRMITKMKINSVRPFNVYGKKQNPKGPYAAAVPKFIDALKNNKVPFITGDGRQFRDFIYVEDVVDLLMKLSESDVTGQVFNAGSGKHTSINALFDTIAGLMKKKVTPKYVEPVNDPNTLAGIEKAEWLLGWRPKHSLVEGLLKTI